MKDMRACTKTEVYKKRRIKKWKVKKIRFTYDMAEMVMEDFLDEKVTEQEFTTLVV